MRMKRFAMIWILSAGLLLCGCGKGQALEGVDEDMSGVEASEDGAKEVSEMEEAESGSETVSGTKASKDEDEQAEGGELSTVVQGGPYGQLSISLPAGWKAEACPVDSDRLVSGIYGIRFYPENMSSGAIELAYIDSFGVCGTGLSSETAVIAGSKASIGTYDDYECWNFISFQEEKEGIVALTDGADEWWDEYGGQAMEILNTLSFDRTIKEGGVCVYTKESEIEEIALQLSLKNISHTGATLVFNQYDKEAPTGELEYGAEYTIEQLKGGEWIELPGPVEGSEHENLVFNAVAYLIKAEAKTEQEIDWEWLHGPLPPGEYRIGKNVHDFRGTGDFDEYTVYGQFLLN